MVIGIGTAFIAAGFSNIMNYIQALFALFNAPLFATFIIGMFWRRMTPGGRLLVADGRLRRGAVAYLLYLAGVLPFDSDLEESFWGAGLAFVTVAGRRLRDHPGDDRNRRGTARPRVRPTAPASASREPGRRLRLVPQPAAAGPDRRRLSLLFYLPLW